MNATLATFAAAAVIIWLLPARARHNPYTHKMRKVMREFKKGRLVTPQGHRVTDRKQAIAIALNEVRRGRKS